MAKPGQPVDEQGKPIFPRSTTSPDDDVQGHVVLAVPSDEEDEQDVPGQGPQIII
jgi:hypothetical protein